MKKYIITEEELTQLIRDSSRLNALEIGGVDNWEWYEEALYEYDADAEIDLDSYEEYVE